MKPNLEFIENRISNYKEIKYNFIKFNPQNKIIIDLFNETNSIKEEINNYEKLNTTLDLIKLTNNNKKNTLNIIKNLQLIDNDKQQHQQINCVENIKDKKINNNKDKSNKYIEEKGEIIYDDDKYYIKIKNYKNRFIEWTINGEKKII